MLVFLSQCLGTDLLCLMVQVCLFEVSEIMTVVYFFTIFFKIL